MEGVFGRSIHEWTDSICTFYEEDGNSILASIFVFDASIANGLLKVMVYFGVIVLFCNAPNFVMQRFTV